jgi:hypothetical protein
MAYGKGATMYRQAAMPPRPACKPRASLQRERSHAASARLAADCDTNRPPGPLVAATAAAARSRRCSSSTNDWVLASSRLVM